MSENWTFLKEFIRKPGQLGAIAPSSLALAREITAEIGLEQARVVVELGPGTGAFTQVVVERMADDAVYLGVENNPAMAALFQERFSQLDLAEASVEDLPQILSARGLGPADCIVSGLPWAIFDDALQRRLMMSLYEAMAHGAHFATFAYLQGLILPPGLRFRRLLNETFDSVSLSRVVYRNLPPALVYRCVMKTRE